MTRTSRFGAWAAVLALAPFDAGISLGLVALAEHGPVPWPLHYLGIVTVTFCVNGLLRTNRPGGLL
jgi:hypothetical protein